jgi:hypothetical protein
MAYLGVPYTGSLFVIFLNGIACLFYSFLFMLAALKHECFYLGKEEETW